MTECRFDDCKTLVTGVCHPFCAKHWKPIPKDQKHEITKHAKFKGRDYWEYCNEAVQWLRHYEMSL